MNQVPKKKDQSLVKKVILKKKNPPSWIVYFSGFLVALAFSTTLKANSCSLPSSPLPTPLLGNITIVNCTTIVVRAYTSVSNSNKNYRFQVFTGGSFNSVTSIYCNTSNMNKTGAVSSGGYLYHNNIQTAYYGTHDYTIVLAEPLPDGAAVSVTARVAISGNHSRYATRRYFAVNYPTINSQPSNAVTCEGEQVSFSVGASGTGLSYEWQMYTTSNGWVPLPNGSSSNYYITPNATGTYYIRCKVRGVGYCYSKYTSQRTLTVYPELTRPSYVSATDGDCDEVVVTWGSVSGATSYTVLKNGVVVATVYGNSTTTWTDTNPSSSSVSYSVRANNNGCFSNYRSNSGYATFAPVVTTHPVSQSICENAPYAEFTVDVNASGVWKRNGVSLGITSKTLTINNPTTADQGSYVYEASNSCGTTSSNAATLTIINPPTPGYTVSGVTMIGQPITLQALGSGNHSWTVITNSGTVMSSTNANFTFTAPETGTYQIYHSVGNLGCIALDTSNLNITPNYSENRPVETSRNIEYTADPVNTASGEFKYRHRLFSIPAVETSLDLDLFYSSQHLENGVLGYGWSHSWNIRMVRLVSPSGDLYIEFGDGSRMYFTEYTGSDPKILPRYAGILDTLIKNTNGTYRLQMLSGEHYLFDNSGKLVSVTDLNGNSFFLSYTTGLLSKITAPGGRYLDLTYDSFGKLIMVTNQVSDVVAFTYFNDNLEMLLNLNSEIFDYVYDGNHRILEIKDPRSITFLKNTYDIQGRVTKQVMADGGEWNLAYNTPVTNATTVTNPGGHDEVFYYDDDFNLVRKVDELGYSEYMIYDQSHLLQTYVNKAGDSTHFKQDARGNQLSITSAMGKQVQSTFTPLNRPDNVSNSLGVSTGLVYDINGNLTRIDLPNTGQINIVRNSTGSVASITDAENRILTYTHSPEGDVTNINTPTGDIVMTYNSIGRLLTLMDQNQKTTSFTYDTYGNVLRVTYHSTAYVEHAYDGNGNMISYRDKAGNYTYFGYNEKDQLDSIHDPMNRITLITRNVLDQITRVDYPNGGYVEYTFTARGNVETTTTIHGTVTNTYNVRGLLIQTEFPNGYIVNYAYDKDGYLIAYNDNIGKVDSLIRDQAGRVYKTKNSLGQETVFTLNDMGQLTGVSHAGIATSTYEVNLNGELETVTNPNGNKTTNVINGTTGFVTSTADPLNSSTIYTYDDVGNPITIALPNGVVETRGYDDEYNLISRSWSNGYYENYTLNANGLIELITTPDGMMSISLNANSEVTAITDQYGFTIAYGLNEAGLPDTINMAGKKVIKSYNTLGQEETTTDWEGDLYTTNYTVEGGQDHFDYPNGIKRYAKYRLDGFLMSIASVDANGDTVFYQNLIRDKLGNVKGEAKPSVFIHSNISLSTETNMYLANDAQSNSGRTSDVLGRLLTFPDGLGNMVTAVYDQKNRIVSMQIGARLIQNFYDANNLLIKQIDDGVEKRFIWDYAYGLPRIIAEADDQGNLTASYVWANGMLVSRVDEITGEKLFYLTDAFGNVVALTDTSGNITDIYTYGPDGEDMQHTGTTQQPFTWRGAFGVVHQFGNIYYVRQRWHDASAGRFLSQDPYPWDPTNNQTLNRYVYGLNNPLSYMDINGMYPQDVDGGMICYGQGNGCVASFESITPPSIYSVWEAYGLNAVNIKRGNLFGFVPMNGGMQDVFGENRNVWHEHIFFSDGSNIGFFNYGIDNQENQESYTQMYSYGNEIAIKWAIVKLSANFTSAPLNRALFPGSNNGEYDLYSYNCQSFVNEVMSLATKIDGIMQKEILFKEEFDFAKKKMIVDIFKARVDEMYFNLFN